MKLKITIMIIFLILSINNVLAAEQIFEKSYNFQLEDYYNHDSRQITVNIDRIYFNDIDYLEGFNFITCNVNVWHGSEETSDYVSTTFYNDAGKTNVVGNGMVGFSKFADDRYRVQFWFMDFNDSLSGAQVIYWDNNDLKSMSASQTDKIPPYSTYGIDYGTTKVRVGGYTDKVYAVNGYHYVQYPYYWINTVTYDYNLSSGVFDFNLDRDSTYTSRLIINDGNEELANETTQKDNDRYVFSQDLENCTWDVTIYSSLEDLVYHELDFCSLIPDDDYDPTAPTLTTDKTYYNTSETITINYTNIDKIYDECTSSFCDEPYQLWIYAITHTEDIPKFRQWLYSDRRDESFILSTSILSPQTTYKLIITSGESNIMIESDIFYVYPDDEYLSLSCENPCSTVNNGNIIIYYKINNNSNIIIKDNDNNIINQYYNIINEGEIIYNIPGDIEHLNTYPNWKIYLNNTDYSTSFNKDLTVYWSLFESPTETPTISPTETPDIDISEQLDNLSTEIKPLKELLFGLVYIVVDNPDYNTDNIVSENEINNWLNSIIPLCLFLSLIILYIGLHKKRE